MPDIVSKATTFAVNEAEFFKRVPFKLTALNLAGAYTSDALPDTFDPQRAAASDLVSHGLLWKRPDDRSDPHLKAAWDQTFNRKWLASDRIVPTLSPQVGVTHQLRSPPTKQTDGTFTGTVWSGAGIKTGSWTTCIGTWVIPTVSKPPEPQGTEGGWNSSSWVGIDGFFISNDVLQAGIQQHVDAAGHATYVAWFEWFAPQTAHSPGYIFQTNITNFPVSPGQTVSCSVQYLANKTGGQIYFANNTTGKHFSITLAPPPGASFAGNSVEWIMEAPDGGEPRSSLPKFTPVTFTSALACGPNGAVGKPGVADTLNITTAAGKLLTKVASADASTTITFIG